MRRLAVGLWVTAWAAGAAAQPGPATTIVCESHGGARPERADELVAATREGLGLASVVQGRELDALVAQKMSSPAGRPGEQLLGLVRAQVDDAQEEVATARFAEAAQRLGRLRAVVAQHAAAVAAEPRVRQQLHRGLMLLLKSFLRLRRQAEAEILAAELDRSFPDFPVTDRVHGPEVAGFLGQLRAHRGIRAPLTLTVESEPSGAALFVDGRYVGTTPLRLADLLPGRYRLLAHAGHLQSRVRSVDVVHESASVRLDLAFDSVLRPGGLQFASPAERHQLEAEYAVRLGRTLGAIEVITMGLGGTGDRPLWEATVYAVESGRVLRSAAVALGPVPPPRSLLAALGRFLIGGAAAEGLIVQQAHPTRASLVVRDGGESPLRPDRSRTRIWQIVAYAGMAVGLAGAGLGSYFVAIDGRGDCTLAPGQLECPRRRHTLIPGAVALASGAALAIGSAVLLFVDLKRARLALTIGGQRQATAVWLAGSF